MKSISHLFTPKSNLKFKLHLSAQLRKLNPGMLCKAPKQVPVRIIKFQLALYRSKRTPPYIRTSSYQLRIKCKLA